MNIEHNELKVWYDVVDVVRDEADQDMNTMEVGSEEEKNGEGAEIVGEVNDI